MLSRRSANNRVFVIFFSLLSGIGFKAIAQKEKYGQFWNEYSFTRSLSHKWSLELNLGQKWTGTPQHPGMFEDYTQFHAGLWAHYYAGRRWKLSYFYAYYYNNDIPELNQKELPELRSAFQGSYNIHKARYTLSARGRIEDRHIKTEDGIFEANYRFRLQSKIVYPVNHRFLTKNTFYLIASEEIFFKSGNPADFDRNRLTAGSGYAFTDHFQVELTYANEFIWGDSVDQIHNVFQVNFGWKNFLMNLEKKLAGRREHRETIDNN